jgi:hypothetical protein
VGIVPGWRASVRDEPWAGFFDVRQAITPKARKTLGIG